MTQSPCKHQSFRHEQELDRGTIREEFLLVLNRVRPIRETKCFLAKELSGSAYAEPVYWLAVRSNKMIFSSYRKLKFTQDRSHPHPNFLLSFSPKQLFCAQNDDSFEASCASLFTCVQILSVLNVSKIDSF